MHDIVQDYYGKQLQNSNDLKTSACCDTSSVPAWLKPLLARVHPEVLARYYGCGLVCPPLLEGCRVLLNAKTAKPGLNYVVDSFSLQSASPLAMFLQRPGTKWR
jgi:hypothetical protein